MIRLYAGLKGVDRVEPILKVNEVSKQYNNGYGIRDVSLEIGKGDIVGLFGPNGAGKTTLLKIITGLIRPDHGSISLFGYDSSEQFETGMACVGCVIESADAYEYMSVYENLKLASRFYPQLKKSRIDQVLELVSLLPCKWVKAGQLSLGLKQRLALAGALLPEPDMVILDEPTNGLDIEGMIDIRQTIERLAGEQGTSFLIASHMIGDMEKLINRYVIIHQGTILKEGNKRDLESSGLTLEQFYMSQIQSIKEDAFYA